MGMCFILGGKYKRKLLASPKKVDGDKILSSFSGIVRLRRLDMKKRVFLFVICVVIFLSGCSAAKQENAEETNAATASAAMAAENEAIINDMDQAFGETIRTNGAVLSEIEYNGAGKVAVYCREFKGADSTVPSSEYWDQSYLPEGLAAEKPEDVVAIAVIDLTAQVIGFTSIEEDVGKPVDQRLVLEVSLYDPPSWSSAFRGYFFGESIPVGSYTIEWAALPSPNMGDVADYIKNTIEQYEAIPVSNNWQAFDMDFGAFVSSHFDISGEWEAGYGEHKHDEMPGATYNGADKFAGCFFGEDDQGLYWTDSIIPDELKADSPDDVAAIVVVQRNMVSGVATAYLISLAGEGAGCSGIASLMESNYPDFASLLSAIKDSVPFSIKAEEPGPHIGFADYGDIVPTHMTVVLENISTFEYKLLYFYPGRALLEQYKDGEWQRIPSLPVSDKWVLTETLPVGGRTKLKLDWVEEYGALAPGQYRVTLLLTGEKLPSTRPAIRFEETLEIGFIVD